MIWTTACPDWESRIVKGKSLIPFEPLFPEYAERAWNVFSSLRVVDILGKPTFKEVSRPWVEDFIKAIFGSYNEDTGEQLIKEFFLCVSKKNSKSTLAAGVMMTALILNWRDTAEFIILAPTKKVAGNSLNPAVAMCRDDIDEELSDLMHVQEHYNKITNLDTKAILNVVAADSQTVSGIKGTGHFVDELWEFGKIQKSKNMFREATGGMASRKDGFIIWATTQSDEAPTGVFAEKLEYARGVRDGKIDDNRFLPVIYEFPDAMLKKSQHLEPKNFYITNPNLGASVDEEFLIREHKKAENAGPESMAGFLAKHLNVQMAMSLKAMSWAGAEFWEKASGSVSLESIIERSEVIVVGIDGGGLDDLLGMAVLGRDSSTRDWLLWSKAWCHPIALERRKSEAARYRDFERDGDLVIVKEIGQDITQAGDIIQKLDDSGLLDRIGVDQAGIGEIVDEIESRGIENDRIVGIPQGWRLNGAVKTAERRVAGTEDGGKRMIHSGSRMMSWCVGNAKGEPRGNAISITKQVSGSGKIDPVMAMFCAVALMAMNPEARSSKVSDNYEAVI